MPYIERITREGEIDRYFTTKRKRNDKKAAKFKGAGSSERTGAERVYEQGEPRQCRGAGEGVRRE